MASVRPFPSRGPEAVAAGAGRLRFLAPFHVRLVPDLRSTRRRTYSGGTTGTEVHAASFIRERRIVLDADLLRRPRELRRIVTHELFHFAWVRLGNRRRRDWELLLAAETSRGRARGEMGWSAEWRKLALKPVDARRRTARWRDYACEAFCDTAAWLLTGARRHPEVTLAARFRARRAAWFAALLSQGEVII